ncbi:MAG TPA: lysozyme inhibitor LprI family protein [Candidatus Angelobacter sp.]|nr:lysozyme inhibitor LprI family protein [Candidatus Angelobacter sp.]
MKMTLGLSLLITAVVMAVPAPAQHMNDKDSPCASIAGTADLVGCLSKAQTSADANLNAFYKKVLETLHSRPDDVGRLRDAERLWLQYRDANCAAERGLYGGGSGGPPAYLSCKEAMTRARTKELQTMYEWLVNK